MPSSFSLISKFLQKHTPLVPSIIFSSELILFYFILCACLIYLLLRGNRVADGAIEEENELGGQPEYEGQYRELEPKDPYREPELPEGFEDGKSNLIL